MNAASLEDILLDPPGNLHKLFLQDDPFPVDTVTNALILIGQHRADPAIASVLQKFQGQRTTTLGKLLSMAAGHVAGRVDVHRGDWLFAEGHTVYALNSLVWLAMCATDDFEISQGGREQCLHNFCSRFSGDETLATVLSSRSQREQRDALISLCIQAIQYVRTEEGEVQVDNENPLIDLHRDPELIVTWPHVLPSVEEKQAHLDQVELALREMPGHLGTLLIGSFAEDTKRDCYSDIDVSCICSELPTKDVRAELAEKLQPGSDEGSSRFMAFGLEETEGAFTIVHMCFISKANQDALFRRRREEGQEFPLIEISNEGLAMASYHLSKGKILSDRDGSLQSYQREAREVPTRYGASLARRFQSTWERYQSAFWKATEQQDQVTALTALNACTEATLRAFLLKYGIHTDPISPTKWLPIEFVNLPTSRLAAMMGREWIPRDASASWSDRFRDIEKLWSLMVPSHT
jgi:hypothetical protein